MISILSPFYNLSPAVLKRFIDSVIAQNVDDYELIIGDDGSTDKDSLDYLCSYEGTTRVKVCHFPHQGVSGTRNSLLKEASGDIIWFADPDDMLMPNAIEIIRDFFVAHPDYSALSFGYEAMTSRGKSRFYHNAEGIITKEDALHSISSGGDLFDGYIWRKAFNLKSIDKDSIPLYDVDLSGFEDKLWLFKMLPLLDRIYSLPDILYRYEYNCSSLTRSLDKRRRQQLEYYKGYDRILDFIRSEYGVSRYYLEATSFYYVFCWNDLFYWSFHKKLYREERELNRTKLRTIYSVLKGSEVKPNYPGLSLRLLLYRLLMRISL